MLLWTKIFLKIDHMEKECWVLKEGSIGQRVNWEVYTSSDRPAPVNARPLNPIAISSSWEIETKYNV